jgi:hypothetical protein
VLWLPSMYPDRLLLPVISHATWTRQLFPVLARPYRVPWVNWLQLTSNLCLLLLAVLNSVGSEFQSVGFDAMGTPFQASM